MNKNIWSRVLSTILSMSVLMTLLSFSVLALDNDHQDAVKGNVPVTFTPSSEITFNADGSYEVTHIEKAAPESREVGHEIEGFEVAGDPAEIEAENQAMIEKFQNLPVYTYDEYYIAKEGAVAQYDQDGQLIRVRGDCEYHSTLDQYMVNGSLPDGTYVGTYLTFSQISSGFGSDSTRATPRTSQSGRMTTFGDNWPPISKSKYPNCNTDPVPAAPKGMTDESFYGDRIGTDRNQLHIGDVAIKNSVGIKNGTKISVHIENDKGTFNKTMTKQDIMNEKSKSILDIWRWDSPDWFTGDAKRADDLYFGYKYSTSLSFENSKNYWET
ncbi:hypothetical protein [Intestinibacillus massiliensis]|uniref:hypothetical protein n=1 Tax=Intestinibacillus massiliensis TaxID=1871029 RepID=UPI000B352011|nr:hypothetical protein [Intestinibacillus massiliensis]